MCKVDTVPVILKITANINVSAYLKFLFSLELSDVLVQDVKLVINRQ